MYVRIHVCICKNVCTYVMCQNFKCKYMCYMCILYVLCIMYVRIIPNTILLLKLENLDNLVPDKWYSSYHYSHPPLVERLRAIKGRVDPSSDKKSD